MRILLMEDDEAIGAVLKSSLETEHFTVDWVKNGEDGAYCGRLNNYDVIILDIVVPKIDGKGVCRRIREKKKNVPIIMLSVMSEIDTKVELFDIGADDYLIKPFSFQELLARIRALLRRPQQQIENKILRFGNLCVDTRKHLATIGDEEIYLTRKEFMLLELLLRKRGETVSRAVIMENVWDMNADPFSNTIETHINSLRKKIGKIGEIGERKIIKTVPGIGYQIEQ